jgi:hypothetical protein
VAQVQVVDLAGGSPELRGTLRLPGGSLGRGWGGCYMWDWYWGHEVVQVGADALALRRWQPAYDDAGAFLGWTGALHVIDLADPDAPSEASVTITDELNGWWGNLKVVGAALYATHYEWVAPADERDPGQVRYYIDRIDLSDRAHPTVGAKINVPGVLVGGSPSDPSILYTIDYRWSDGAAYDAFDVVRIDGDVAELVSETPLDGWVGATFVRGDVAYMSTQRYQETDGPQVTLHAIDLSDPVAPVDRVASDRAGWGWLLAVEGDRALVSSGWGAAGVDIYKLSAAAPVFDRFVRTRGWWTQSVSRQGSALYLASGYWGVQRIDLE